MKVLFVCIENTCRSQMAEGFAKQLGLDAESAGVRAGAGVNPDAVEVMDEIGIDIRGQQSKEIAVESLAKFDKVISMCSVKTADICPSTFLGMQENWNIDDPKGESPDFFRRVRDEIKSKVENLATQSKTGQKSASSSRD